MFFRLDPTSILLLDQKLRLEKPLPLFQTFARLPPFSQTSPNFQPPLMPSTPSPCPPTSNPLMVFDSLYFFVASLSSLENPLPLYPPVNPRRLHFPPVFRFHPLLPIRQAFPTPVYLPVKTRPVRLYTLTRWAFRASRYGQAVSDPSGSFRASRWNFIRASRQRSRASRLSVSGEPSRASRQRPTGRAVRGEPSGASRLSVSGEPLAIGRAVSGEPLKTKPPDCSGGLPTERRWGIRRFGFACIRLCGLLLRRCLDTSRRE